jgi:hypothetical protein
MVLSFTSTTQTEALSNSTQPAPVTNSADHPLSQTPSNRPLTDVTGSEEEEKQDELAELLAYAKVVAKLGDRINEAGESFGEAALDYREGAITIEDFKGEYLAFKPEVRSLIQEINRLSPPPAAVAIHDKLTAGLEKCDKAIDLMDEWFDNQDSETKEVTVLLVANCIDQVTKAGEELELFVKQTQAAQP